jgi:hypothetical protein
MRGGGEMEVALQEESLSATDFQSTPLARKGSSVPYPKATSGDTVRLFVLSILQLRNREDISSTNITGTSDLEEES